MTDEAAAEDWENVDIAGLSIKDLDEPMPNGPPSVSREMLPAADNSVDAKPPEALLTKIQDPPVSVLPPGNNMAPAGVEGFVDPFLLDALDNPRNRLMILKFEDTIVNFMRAPREQLDFPPLSSYQRMTLHRLAVRFNLAHQSVSVGPMVPGYDRESRAIMLFKTPQSFIPEVLLINLSSKESVRPTGAGGVPGCVATPKKQVKLMKRDPANSGGRRGGGHSNGSGRKDKNQAKTVSEREKDYAAARARIFGTESSAITPAEEGDSRQQVAQTTCVIPQAKGPDGSIGFGAGRGKSPKQPNSSSGAVASRAQRSPALVRQQQNQPLSPASPQSELRAPAPMQSQNSSPGVPSATLLSAASPAAPANPTEAKNHEQKQGKKVLWRNRHAELHDPDFQRNAYPYRVNYGGGQQMGGQMGAYADPGSMQAQQMRAFDGYMQSGQPLTQSQFPQHEYPPSNIGPYDYDQANQVAYPIYKDSVDRHRPAPPGHMAGAMGYPGMGYPPHMNPQHGPQQGGEYMVSHEMAMNEYGAMSGSIMGGRHYAMQQSPPAIPTSGNMQADHYNGSLHIMPSGQGMVQQSLQTHPKMHSMNQNMPHRAHTPPPQPHQLFPPQPPQQPPPQQAKQVPPEPLNANAYNTDFPPLG